MSARQEVLLAPRITAEAERQRRPLDGRWLMVAVLLAYFAVLFSAAHQSGSLRGWERVGVPALSPGFADLRVITSALDSARDGHDPLVNNASDRWGRPMNYPRLWLAAKYLGLGERHTIPLGLGTAFIFYGTVLLVSGRVTIAEGLVYGALLCSPTLMLAVERGNIDLLVFGLVALAATLWSRKLHAWSAAAILLASTLKLYPMCALAMALRERTRAALISAALVAAAFGFYVFWTWRDIIAVIAGTPAARFPAYGRELLFLSLESLGFGGDPVLHSLLLIGAVFVGALFCARRFPRLELSRGPGEKLIVGFAVYAGTFAFLSSFSYRMVFLLLALPQLLLWSRRGGSSRYFAVGNLVAIGTALYLAAVSHPTAQLLKELTTWLLFASACFVLLQSVLVPAGAGSARRSRSAARTTA